MLKQLTNLIPTALYVHRRLWGIIGAGLLIAALLTAGAGFYLKNELKNSEVTTGKVVGFEKERTKQNNKKTKTKSKVVVQWKLNDHSYQFTDSDLHYSIGETLSVRYNPSNPQSSAEIDTQAGRSIPLVLWGLSGLLLLVGAGSLSYWYLYYRKNKQLPEADSSPTE